MSGKLLCTFPAPRELDQDVPPLPSPLPRCSREHPSSRLQGAIWDHALSNPPMAAPSCPKACSATSKHMEAFQEQG